METPTFEIKEEPLSQKWGEVSFLLQSHWDEVALNKEVMVLNPITEEYTALENAGKLITLFAYKYGVMVGYSCSIVSQSLHYRDLTVAKNDVLFVHPAFRNSPLGLKLMRRTEQLAKERGCKMMLWHVKPDTPLHKLMEAKKNKVQDIIYSKILED